jgi:enediyne biosynthesis protein E4
MAPGVAVFDYDNDGDLDVYLVQGTMLGAKKTIKDATYPPAGPLGDRLFRNDLAVGSDGKRTLHFIDVTGPSGINVMSYGMGVAAADYDNDGRVDLAVSSIGGPLLLLRNTGAAGHWLEVSLPRFAPGARVSVLLPDGRRLVREVHAGSSYLSSEDPRVHFGLGAATRVRELVVRYPDGKVVRLPNVAVDRIVSVRT